MERRTIYTLGGLGAAIALVAVVFGRAPHAAAEARVPTDKAEILEKLPYASTDARSREIGKLRQLLAQSPQNLRAATRLARLDIELSRERSDPRFLGHAQAALAPWWSDPNAPVEVLVLEATIEQSLHDFESALADLDRALAIEPGHVQALLTRAVVLTVRGRYDEARATCARLRDRTPPLVVTVCETGIDGVTGHAKEAYERLAGVLERSREDSKDSEAWARSSLGELALRTGDWDAAAKHFARTLELDPEDAYVRGAYADLMIDRGMFGDAIALTKGREVNDALLLRLAIAERRSRAKEAEAHVAMLAARFDASRLRGDVVHRREESRFELSLRDDPKKALALAQANWEVQKEPWDVRVFVEAALAAREPKAAEPVLAWLEASKLEDPVIAKAAASLRGTR
jgi:tetratricopeptide (TPR) repeat protein